MKKMFLWLTVLGTVLPNIFVFKESMLSGNYLLYAKPAETLQKMFANHVSSAFITDLLFVVILFLVWTIIESKKLKIRGVHWIWIYTFTLGIAGGLPLFLYLREKRKEQITSP